jgi:hypothetical protein
MSVTLLLAACGTSSSKSTTGRAKDDKTITCAHVVPNAATYFPGATLHETNEPSGPSCKWSGSEIHETALVMVSCMAHYDRAEIDERLEIAQRRMPDLQLLYGIGEAAWLGHTTLGRLRVAGEVFDDDTPCIATIAIGTAWDSHARDVAHDVVANITPADVK